MLGNTDNHSPSSHVIYMAVLGDIKKYIIEVELSVCEEGTRRPQALEADFLKQMSILVFTPLTTLGGFFHCFVAKTVSLCCCWEDNINQEAES